jgi:hypothetical protein
MASKKKAPPPVDQATAVAKPGMNTLTKKVSGTQAQVTATKASPGWASAPPEVQKKLDEWGQSGSDMDANQKKIGPARSALALLIGNQRVLQRRWSAKKKAFYSSVNDYADGSKDIIANLALDVLTMQPVAPQGVPQNVRDRHLKTRGSAGAAWDRMKKPDFMVQTCTNPADPSTYGELCHVTRSLFTITGQTPGATLQVRVQTLDSKLPNGKSEFSPWVPIIVGV